MENAAISRTASNRRLLVHAAGGPIQLTICHGSSFTRRN
jgi:hypothetical protein